MAAASTLHFLSAVRSFTLSAPPPTLSKARNFVPVPTTSAGTGCAEDRRRRQVRVVQATSEEGGAISSLIEGPNPKRYLGDDYVVKKVSARQLEELVKAKRDLPLIVGFYATWCGPCVHMAQELEMLAVEYEDTAMFVKVNTDDEYEFARDMQVRGLPTLYFISSDPKKHAIRTEGLVPSSMIKDIIDNEM